MCVGTSSTDVTRNPENNIPNLPKGIGENGVENAVFESVKTQTESSSPPVNSTTDDCSRPSGSTVRPVVDRFPTSKADVSLPEELSELSDEATSWRTSSDTPTNIGTDSGTQTEHITSGNTGNEDIVPSGNSERAHVFNLTVKQGNDDLSLLNFAAENHSPNFRAYVASITKNRSTRNEFLSLNADVSIPNKVCDSWYVPVHLRGRTYHLLCDTGSAATIIPPRLYKRLPSTVKTPLVAPGVRLRSASKDGLSVSGLCCLEMELGNKTFPCRVLVADVDYDGILGSNFLEHYGCVLDIASGLMQLPHGKIYMAKGRKPSSCRVMASSDAKVPAHAQMVLNCRVKSYRKMTSPVSVVESLQRTVSRHGILVGRCLVNTGPQIPVLLLNPGTTPVTIRAGSSIALLKPICYLDDCQVNEIFSESILIKETDSDQEQSVAPVPPGTVGNLRPDLSNIPPPLSHTDGGRTTAGTGGSLFPVHSSVNSMVSDGNLDGRLSPVHSLSLIHISEPTRPY